MYNVSASMIIMQCYLDYEISLSEYKRSFDLMRDLIDERERAFIKTQPHSIFYDRIKVKGGPHNDIMAQ